LSDSWLYKDVAGEIAGELSKKKTDSKPQLTKEAALLSEALDTALEMVGRNGRDVLYGLLETRYGLKAGEIQTKPGAYMSALRDILDSAANVVERIALSNLKERTGVDAHTFEEAAEKLKGKEFVNSG